jgi:hypothetical protein
VSFLVLARQCLPLRMQNRRTSTEQGIGRWNTLVASCVLLAGAFRVTRECDRLDAEPAGHLTRTAQNCGRPSGRPLSFSGLPR